MMLSVLEQVKCRHPFSLLGWQTARKNKKNNGLLLRVYIPWAVSVEATDAENGASLGALTADTDVKGIFELSLPKKKKPVPYKLHVSDGQNSVDIIDPYQFQQEAFYAVHHLKTRPENLYKQLGAQPIELDFAGKTIKATRFAVYAPNASSVSLIGDMNYWDGRCHPMEQTLCGHWVLVLPFFTPGMRYKFEIKDQSGHVLPHKSDPMAFYAEQYPSHASLTYDHKQYQWQDQAWFNRKEALLPYQEAISIYELHLGSWRRGAQDSILSYSEIAEQLIPYVLEMGFTHIELLPVMEYPFDGSWGYQPLGLFAPTSRFGTPDDLKALIDACHQAGIGVILDWVPAHFPVDGHGLSKFDGTYLYEYEDPRRGWHPDWNSCIYDYGKDFVRQFLVASALYWFDHFHVDALRVDAVASMLYWDYSRDEGEWVPNIHGGNHNYEAISFFKWLNQELYQRYPHAMMIAEESTSFPAVSRPVDKGGLGFGFKWNMGWMNDTLRFMSKNPAYRRYHHDDMTFAMVYAYNENFILPLSHDEVVHGKGSLLNKMPGDEWQQAANLRAYFGFMFAHPGKKLNFMGNEFAQGSEWNHTESLQWHLLSYEKHSGMQKLFRDLNHTYRNFPALYEYDYQPEGFRWLDHQDAERNLLSFARYDSKGNAVYIVCNFTPVPRDNVLLGVDSEGDYRVILNTDSHYYWGSNYKVGGTFPASSKPLHGLSHSICLNIPPLATLYICK